MVYVDELFLLNFLLDDLLLILTARLAGVFAPRRRLLLAAALGAAAAVVLYFPHLATAPGLLARAAVCVGMVLAAFGRQRGPLLRLCALLCGATFALAGGVSALAYLGGGLRVHNGVVYFDLPLGLLLACAAAVWAALALCGGTRFRPGRRTARLDVTLGGRTVVVRALHDSGNLLRDPMTGRQVALLGRADGEQLLPPEQRPLLRALDAANAAAVCAELVSHGAGAFRLMPWHTAAGRDALLLTVRPDRLEIDGRADDGYLLGFAPAEIETGGDCRALIGG